MPNNNKTPSFALPIVLAFLGFAFLSSAIVLVPQMADALSAGGSVERQPCAPCPVIPAVVAPVAQVTAPPEDPPLNLEIPPPELGTVEPSAVLSSGSGPWVLRPDPGDDYRLDAEGEGIVAMLAEMMKNDRTVNLKLVGVNNTNKSRKKALFAATVLKETIGKKAKVSRNRIQTDGIQEAQIEGVEVRVERTGGEG